MKLFWERHSDWIIVWAIFFGAPLTIWGAATLMKMIIGATLGGPEGFWE